MATITVMDWQRVVLFTDGRFDRVLEPGRHRHRTRRTTTHTVDMRQRSMAVAGQELLTSDGLTLKASVLVQWRVVDPLAFLTTSTEPTAAIYTAAQLAVRDAVGAVSLDDVLADRGRLSAGLRDATVARIDGLGVEVTSVLVKDLMLPGELRRAATETLLAREQGRATLERARAEAASLRTLANAARLLEEHPVLLRLRTIQAATVPGATVVLSSDGVRPPTSG